MGAGAGRARPPMRTTRLRRKPRAALRPSDRAGLRREAQIWMYAVWLNRRTRSIGRTADLVGSVVGHGAQGRNRTTDTVIFSHVLYQLSYLGAGRAGKSPGG